MSQPISERGGMSPTRSYRLGAEVLAQLEELLAWSGQADPPATPSSILRRAIRELHAREQTRRRKEKKSEQSA